MTVRDLITSSFRLIGATATGETLTADEANNALVALNDMLETWITQKLLIYSQVPETFSLVANQYLYTWGTGGDFSSARPQKVENVNWLQTSGTTTVELPIEIINQDQYAAISVKGTTSNLPTRVWPVFDYPLAKMYFWPVPSIAGSVKIWSWKALTAFASLDSVLSLPPGYSRALRYNLAVELAPEYGRPLDPAVIELAIESKSSIKRMNTQINLLGTDPAISSKKSTWNWFTGE